jgi:chaperonin GroEL
MNITKTKTIENTTDQILKGINKSANVIISTMGGYGQNVILATQNDLWFTKDGVSVAKHLKLDDEIENIGSKLLIDAANKTVEQCGDGTTLTSLFIKTLANELTNRIKEGADVNLLMDNLNDFIEQFRTELLSRAKVIDSFDEIYRIAKTSAKSPVLGSLITDVYKETGYNAVISLEKSQVSETTYYEVINGLNFESGMINSRFSNQDNGNCIFDNCTVLLETDTVNSFQEYADVLDTINKNQGSVVIIAPQFSDSFVHAVLSNKQRLEFKICLIKSPGYGKSIIENYEDIIAFSNNDNTVDKIVVTPFDFTIYNTTNENKIEKRINKLKKLAESSVESYDEESYNKRITRLNQSGAIIYVGGITQKSLDETYDRTEDAIGAVKTALVSGYVRGAGCELHNIGEVLREHPFNGKSILEAPMRQILRNAKIDKYNIKYDQPYNVILKNYDDSIIDPVNVLINSLVNAASLVTLLINTSYIVYND